MPAVRVASNINAGRWKRTHANARVRWRQSVPGSLPSTACRQQVHRLRIFIHYQDRAIVRHAGFTRRLHRSSNPSGSRPIVLSQIDSLVGAAKPRPIFDCLHASPPKVCYCLVGDNIQSREYQKYQMSKVL